MVQRKKRKERVSGRPKKAVPEPTPRETTKRALVEAYRGAQKMEKGPDREHLLYLLRHALATVEGLGQIVRRQEHLSVFKDGK